MWSRLSFCLVTAFFIAMNVLLWRWEFGSRHERGSSIPLETVWQKMLIAPDNSQLEIRRHGKKIGHGTWVPSVGEEFGFGKRILEEDLEGMIPEPSSYSIDFSGNFSIDSATRLRFSMDLKLTTNHQWQELRVDLRVRPYVWEIQASAATETVRFSSNDEGGRSEQTFKFADLQRPEKLLQDAGLPLSPGILAAMGLQRNPAAGGPATLGLKWEARNDWLKIANERLRVYRVQARLLERFQMVLFISFEGQILRVELPDDIVLINDQLTIL